MKNFIFVFIFLFCAIAQASNYEEALKRTLDSVALQDVKANLTNLELTDTKIERVETGISDRDQFKITLFYSAVGTAGGCYVHADVTHSQMELVSPGGEGYHVHHIWKVEAKQGICPR